MADLFDVAVVGAGPAGTSAALQVLRTRPDARVALLDAADFPRDKTCGDGIAAHVFDVLESLGVEGLERLGPPVPRLRLRIPSGRTVDRTCARPNRVIPRKVFDAELVRAAVSRGALPFRHRVRGFEVRSDRVVLDNGVEARVVIGADGANSSMRRLLGGPRYEPNGVAVAIRGYASHSLETDALVIEFARAAYPAYAWAFPLPDGRSNVGYGVFHANGGGNRQELLDMLQRLLPGLPPEPESVRGHRLPLSSGQRFHPDGRVLLAGDAAAMVNPFTGEGIYEAVVSGVLAGRAALLGAHAGRAHRQAMRRRFGRHQRHTAWLADLIRRDWFLEAGLVAAARDHRVFDATVELGLGTGTIPFSAIGPVLTAALHVARERSRSASGGPFS